jgi:hypothetical protein
MSERNDHARDGRPDLAPADFLDPVIEAYQKDVDRTLLRENLKLSPEQRVRKAESIHRSVERVRDAARLTTNAEKGNEEP